MKTITFDTKKEAHEQREIDETIVPITVTFKERVKSGTPGEQTA